MISSEIPDWSREKPREFWDPSRKLLRSVRRYQATRNPAVKKWWVLVHRFWSVITQAEIHLNSKIGGGLMMPHPNGIVVHPKAVLGPNCLLFQQVTIGTRGGSEDDCPQIGGHVDVGAGAKILGNVTIGSHASIGANAVVLHDVEAGAVVAGIPARVRSSPIASQNDVPRLLG